MKSKDSPRKSLGKSLTDKQLLDRYGLIREVDAEISSFLQRIVEDVEKRAIIAHSWN